jgi:putative endonuclease
MRGQLRTNLLEWVVTALDAVPARRPALPPHLLAGQGGELAAYFYLRRCGYTVVARGWRSKRARGDLDLVAWEGDTLAIVEVKSLAVQNLATAEAAIDKHKRHTLRRLAEVYLRALPQLPPVRFDVLSIYGPHLGTRRGRHAARYELFRNAFAWSE